MLKLFRITWSYPLMKDLQTGGWINFHNIKNVKDVRLFCPFLFFFLSLFMLYSRFLLVIYFIHISV